MELRYETAKRKNVAPLSENVRSGTDKYRNATRYREVRGERRWGMQREGLAGFKHIARFFYASDDLAGSREDKKTVWLA